MNGFLVLGGTLSGIVAQRARCPALFLAGETGADLELHEHKARQAPNSAVDHHLPALRPQIRRNNAVQRLSFLLRLQRLRNPLETEAGPLLRLLQLRLSPMSAHADRRVMLRLNASVSAHGTILRDEEWTLNGRAGAVV